MAETTYEYIGGDAFITGVPARDLTSAEAKQFGVKKSPLYKRVKGTEDKQVAVQEDK